MILNKEKSGHSYGDLLNIALDKTVFGRDSLFSGLLAFSFCFLLQSSKIYIQKEGLLETSKTTPSIWTQLISISNVFYALQISASLSLSFAMRCIDCWKLQRSPLYVEPNLSFTFRSPLYVEPNLSRWLLTIFHILDHPFMLNPTSLDVSWPFTFSITTHYESTFIQNTL